MLAYIEDKRSVRNEELLEKFNVSIQTLRRDLKTFEDQGFIDKVYGGVIYNNHKESVSSVSPDPSPISENRWRRNTSASLPLP